MCISENSLAIFWKTLWCGTPAFCCM